MGYMACGHVQNIPESIYVLTLFQAFKSAGTTNSVWGQLELSKTDSWMDTTDILWRFKAERRSMTYLLLKYAMSAVAENNSIVSFMSVFQKETLLEDFQEVDGITIGFQVAHFYFSWVLRVHL